MEVKISQRCFQRCLLSMVFVTFPESATKAFNIIRPETLQVEVTVLDNDEQVVLRKDSQPVLTALY